MAELANELSGQGQRARGGGEKARPGVVTQLQNMRNAVVDAHQARLKQDLRELIAADPSNKERLKELQLQF